MDIVESNEIKPSVGIALTLGTLLYGSLEFNAGIGARILSYVGMSVANLAYSYIP
jgi:hypothetical protein